MSKNRFSLIKLMKKLTFLFLSFTLLVSCRKEFASFQKSPNINYTSPKKSIAIPVRITQPAPSALIASTQDSFTEPIKVFGLETNEAIIQKQQIQDDGRRKNRKNISRKQETFFEKVFPNQHTKDKKTVKKRRKPVPLSSTIYTGFIILGIAILLALVSLNSLSLLFGVASILFLYLGFKKYFRKKRRRDIFR